MRVGRPGWVSGDGCRDTLGPTGHAHGDAYQRFEKPKIGLSLAVLGGALLYFACSIEPSVDLWASGPPSYRRLRLPIYKAVRPNDNPRARVRGKESAYTPRSFTVLSPTCAITSSRPPNACTNRRRVESR